MICAMYITKNMALMLSHGVAPWLLSLVNAGQKSPLPVAALSHYSAIDFMRDGGLLVTAYGPSGPHRPGQPTSADIPLVTFGVAQLRAVFGNDAS